MRFSIGEIKAKPCWAFNRLQLWGNACVSDDNHTALHLSIRACSNAHRFPSGVQSTPLIGCNWQLPTCDCLGTCRQTTHGWVMGGDQRFVEFLWWGLLGWEELEVMVLVGGTWHFGNKQLLCQWWLVNRCPSHHPCSPVPLSMIYSFNSPALLLPLTLNRFVDFNDGCWLALGILFIFDNVRAFPSPYRVIQAINIILDPGHSPPISSPLFAFIPWNSVSSWNFCSC